MAFLFAVFLMPLLLILQSIMNLNQLKKLIFKCIVPLNRLMCFVILSITIILSVTLPCQAETDFSFFEAKGTVPTLHFETSQKDISIDQLSSTDFLNLFMPLHHRKLIASGKTHWFFLDFSDIDLSLSDSWILNFTDYDEITLFYEGESGVERRFSGKLKKENAKDMDDSSTIPFQIFELIDGYYLIAKIEHNSIKYRLRPPNYYHPLASKFSNEYFTREFVYDQVVYLLFIGGMLLMILYSFGIYFMNRDKLFNYYGIYLLALLLYLGVRMPLLYDPLTDFLPRFMYVYNELIQVLVNITYLLFAAHFMNARVHYPKLCVAINYAIRFLVLIMFVQLVLMLSARTAYLEHYLVQFERYFMILFTVAAYIYMIIHLKQRIVIFLLAGSLFFLVGGVTAMLFHQIKYMMLGAAIEVFVFSLGMGYRIKLVEQEKNTIETEITKVKLTALRAQMNPHFIFNSLNSIRAYVISNETKMASDYLNKFARLIRLILHYSSKDAIPLKEELETLRLYVEQEQMRYREDFGFEIKIFPGVDIENWLVPPLILQPYVENAIGHGLAPKTGEKKLLIEIAKSGNTISFTIRDNGVGRSYSKKFSNLKNEKHKSVAMELTQKRIDLASENETDDENIEIIDIEESGKALGTEVRFKLPIQTV